MHPGLCIPNWAGCTQWQVETKEYGYGWNNSAGCGPMKHFIHSFTKTVPPAGFISTEQAKVKSSSTITGMNDGCRWTVENSLTEFILPFYHAKY